MIYRKLKPMNSPDLHQNNNASRQTPNASILVAENDSAAVRAILKSSALKGIIATVANDIAEALRLCEHGRFDLVFIGRSFCSPGSRLLDKIKIVNPEMPVILLTDHKNDRSINETVQDIVRLVHSGITAT